MGFLSQVVAESRRSPTTILSGARVDGASMQGQFRDLADTTANTVVPANLRNSIAEPLRTTQQDSDYSVLPQSDAQLDETGQRLHLRHTTSPRVDSMSQNKVSPIGIQSSVAVASARAESAAIETKIEAANNSAPVLHHTDATQSRRGRHGRNTKVTTAQQQSATQVVPAASQSPGAAINPSTITPTPAASTQTIAIQKIAIQKETIQQATGQTQTIMAASEAPVATSGIANTASSTTVDTAIANTTFPSRAIHGRANTVPGLTPSSLANAPAASPSQKRSAPTQVRIGQVNVLVESTQPAVKTTSDSRKQYDADSRLFLRGP